jgi:Nucleoside-diphosphate-sugar epimerases
MKILITGAAGFIGFHTSKRLLMNGHNVVGVDNLNNYYPVSLKEGRLALLNNISKDNFSFINADISSFNKMEEIFISGNFDVVCNLAAQAGVRYSFENPHAYIQSNIVGFMNLIELCKKYNIEHFVYASSSSVYGNNNKVPFSELDNVDKPQSIYAATKKSDELMAYVYSGQLGLKTTGLRFFTVYGPWGRPDMAPYLFMKSIINGEPIKVFNNGNLNRDFSYIDDIVTGTVKVIESQQKPSTEYDIPYRLYNIGNSHPINLMDFIGTIEEVTGKKAIKVFTEMQRGDVYTTYADTSKIEHDFDFKPNTPLIYGITELYKWYKDYYK